MICIRKYTFIFNKMDYFNSHALNIAYSITIATDREN